MVQSWVHDEGPSVLHAAGVRVLVGLLANDLKTDDAIATIEELEWELGAPAELALS